MYSAEVIARLGFDWVCIDAQHGLAGHETTVAMLQATQFAPMPMLVRVRDNDPALIGRALDAGADGVIVPMIENAAGALRAAQACRYPPAGKRSWGPIRAALHDPGYDLERANNEVLCVIQVETREGVENVDAILATEGIDAVYVGPNDLGVSYKVGPTGDPTNPQHLAAIATILDACLRHDVNPGIHCGTVDAARRWIDEGFRMINVASDALFMRKGAEDVLLALRARDDDDEQLREEGPGYVSR
jgi:4-hydroxy-2-oxoheptanedioate aldolase